MKNKLLAGILAVLLCSISFAHAQDVEGDEPAPGSSITPDLSLLDGFIPTPTVPNLKSATAIFYSDGISVSVELETVTATSVIVVDQNNAADTRTLSVAGGKVQFSGATAGKNYLIKAFGSDRQLYVIGSLNTTPFVPGNPINVSGKLYRALSEYVTPTNQTTSISSYLQQLPTISMHEKVAFVQKYIMNGAVLPATVKGQFPTAYITQAITQRMGEEECLCNFVVNDEAYATPDAIQGDLAIQPVTYAEGPKWYNSSSFWLRKSSQKGPSKDMGLQSAGQTAGNKTREKIWVSGEEGNSDSYARMSYHFFCINLNQVPEACDCDKYVRFDYGYYTDLEARSSTGGLGCILNQDASARAQDWAAALVTREKLDGVNDVQVFASGTGVATSTCEGGVPVSVIIDALKIGTDVLNTLKQIKTGNLDDLLGQTNQIIDKVGAVLDTIFQEKLCSDALIQKPLAQGSTIVTLKPNDPTTFLIISGSTLDVTGRRCWTSSARVKSSFHLTGILQGGLPNPSDIHCCTDYVAHWIYSSHTGDQNSRRAAVNNYLGLNNPGGWTMVNKLPNPGGNVNATTDIGQAIAPPFPNGGRCPTRIPQLSALPR